MGSVAQETKIMSVIKKAIAIVLCLSANLGLAEQKGTVRLSLQEYLTEVKQKHDGFKAAEEASSGAKLRVNEGKLLLAPTIFGSTQYTHDERPTLAPAFQGNKTLLESYSLGVSQLTSFGLRAALSYNINSTNIQGISPGLVSLPEYYDTKPLLELNQSLWRNFLGAETQAEQERLEAQALATSHEQGFRTTLIFADAEAAYWRLAVATDAVAIQEASLERANEIRNWLSRQVRLQLSDKADLLQATAAVRTRELDLKAAQDEVRQAAMIFNTLRGNQGAEVKEALESVSSDKVKTLSAPVREGFRKDVLAAKERERAAMASSKLGLQRASPTLEIFSQLALNGRDEKIGEATDESFTKRHPYAAVGLRFSAPLDLGKTFDTRDGYRKELIAAELDYDRRVFEQEQEWQDLVKRLTEAKERMSLADEIVAAQREKLEYERQRRRLGRTTTYQVLLFEQDYAASQLSRLRAQFTILDTVARMKTFGGKNQ